MLNHKELKEGVETLFEFDSNIEYKFFEDGKFHVVFTENVKNQPGYVDWMNFRVEEKLGIVIEILWWSNIDRLLDNIYKKENNELLTN